VPFSRYPYYITVRNRDLDQATTRGVARDLYRLLVGTGHREAMIIWNGQRPVDPTGHGREA
jgi:hypothetical protein